MANTRMKKTLTIQKVRGRTALKKLLERQRREAEAQEKGRKRIEDMLEELGYGACWREDSEENFLLCDGFEDCAVGVMERFGMQPLMVYDKTKILDKLAMETKKSAYRTPGDDPDTAALEHFEFNIIGAWMGEGTPAFITLFPKERKA